MSLLGVPVEFVIFGAVLVGVALFHRLSLPLAATGFAVAAVWRVYISGWAPFQKHLLGEWVGVANLFLLLLGFAILASHFEQSKVPELTPRVLPDDWTGGFALLGVVFVLSAFLDNIAAAVIGGVLAKHSYKNGVSVGFLAALVASANAGGAGSVVGDTTTTMIWLAGVSPLLLLKAFVGAFPAFLVIGFFAARQQHRYSPIAKTSQPGVVVDWVRLALVVFALTTLLSAHVFLQAAFPELERRVPVVGPALWVAILASAGMRRPDWRAARSALKGAIFLSALVALASLMPLQRLPGPSAMTTLGLGLLSAVFDNIPLTALALKQGGYDWPLLAYAVGFGGSMAWFGSSAGVALTNLYPSGRSLGRWVREGWYVPLAYFVGFAMMQAGK